MTYFKFFYVLCFLDSFDGKQTYNFSYNTIYHYYIISSHARAQLSRTSSKLNVNKTS